jgi:hypothetical protein
MMRPNNGRAQALGFRASGAYNDAAAICGNGARSDALRRPAARDAASMDHGPRRAYRCDQRRINDEDGSPTAEDRLSAITDIEA